MPPIFLFHPGFCHRMYRYQNRPGVISLYASYLPSYFLDWNFMSLTLILHLGIQYSEKIP